MFKVYKRQERRNSILLMSSLNEEMPAEIYIKQTYKNLVCTVLIVNIQGIVSVPDSLAGKVWILLIYLNCEVPCCLKLH